jgi:hypothetical protein
MNGAELVAVAHRSIAQVETLTRREVTRIRMHPLDWEEIVGYYTPSKRPQAGEMARLLGRALVLDESRRIGEPIAEFDE